jgi:hypothetical protein
VRPYEYDHAEANQQRYACRYDGVATGLFRQPGHTRDVTRLFIRCELVADSCNDLGAWRRLTRTGTPLCQGVSAGRSLSGFGVFQAVELGGELRADLHGLVMSEWHTVNDVLASIADLEDPVL